MQGDQAKKQEIVANICEFIPEWKEFKLEDITISRMTGITNQIYRVSCPGHESVIFRKFGQSQTNVFLDRDAEEVVYKHISEEKQGPRIYGMTKTVRLESFIESQVLKTEQMLEKGYLEKVAYILRYFHDMKAPNIHPDSLLKRIFMEPTQKILKICQNRLNEPIFDESEKEDVQLLKKWVCQEQINFLGQITQEIEKVPLVFSHNDLLANNILIKASDQRAIFIDYEYSCFNYRIFDIANYFNETEYDYNISEPPYFGEIPRTEEKEKMKDKFIRCYCAAQTVEFDDYMKRVDNEDFELTGEEKQMYDMLKSQLNLGIMLSNIMWGWWAIIVCKNPNIQFDYIKFAMKRYRDYMSIKNQGKYK